MSKPILPGLPPPTYDSDGNLITVTGSGQDFVPLPTFEDLPNLPVNADILAASVSQNTPADQIGIASLYGTLDAGVGALYDQSFATQNSILNNPTLVTYRDQLEQYSSPGYEAITREMLAAESQAISRAAIATGQNAATSLRRSGITDSGLAGAFQTLGAVRGAGDRAILEGNRLSANASFRLTASGQLGDLADLETDVLAKFGDQRFDTLNDTLNLLLTTPGTLAERTEGIRQFNLGMDAINDEIELDRIALTADIDAATMSDIDIGLQTILSILGAGGDFSAGVRAAGLGWLFSSGTGNQ